MKPLWIYLTGYVLGASVLEAYYGKWLNGYGFIVMLIISTTVQGILIILTFISEDKP